MNDPAVSESGRRPSVTLAPIVLFVYRRPDHAQRLLDSLRRNPEAAASELFIYSDGPKTAQDAPAVQAVRDLCRTTEGFARVTLVERPSNWGLARSVIAGVTEICGAHGRVIVLEDDLVLSPHFLAYMNDALDRYENEERVMQVSGHMFPVAWGGQADAAFLPMTTSWGWATWQRAWAHFDPDMKDYARLKADRSLRKAFDLGGAYPYFDMLEAQRRGRVDSWAIRWWLNVFMKQGISLFPMKTLVQNHGFDGSGTHCGGDGLNDEDFWEGKIWRYPEPEIDSYAYEIVRQFLSSQMSTRSSFMNNILKVFKL